MPSTKQPQPAAIRITSNIGLLPLSLRSGPAAGVQGHSHRDRKGEVQRQDEPNLEQDLAWSGRMARRLGQRL